MRPSRLAILLLAGVLSVVVGGCGMVTVTVGQRPAADVLDASLAIGVSTEDDVLRVLGLRPFGKGRSLLPVGTVQRPMDMWTYEYSEAYVDIPTITDIRSTYLFVYFEEGRYQGYMWFTSLPR
jgi:hypothetical protein